MDEQMETAACLLDAFRCYLKNRKTPADDDRGYYVLPVASGTKRRVKEFESANTTATGDVEFMGFRLTTV